MGVHRRMRLIIFFIIAAVLLRLLPHIPNFAPITAIALFGGAYLSKRTALFLPLLIMIVSDYLLLYFSNNTFNFERLISPLALFHKTTFFVYFSFLISSLVGIYFAKRKTFLNIGFASIIASLQFFIITNFGVWAATTMYPKAAQGLLQSYIMAIPFFRATLLGDLFYTGAFFGSFEIVKLIARRHYFATSSK